MCGIGGIIRLDDAPPHAAQLQLMIDRLTSRGPDDRGIMHSGRCSLVHTRLAIVDLRDGHQPMSDTPGGEQIQGITVTFNGEIYNHRALRLELQQLGHRFVTNHSDTEVIVHGYRQWGTRLASRLEGMFALGIWNADAKQLYLARDRAGKKPLYYCQTPHRFVFASLLPAVLAGMDHVPDIDHNVLAQYLMLGYTTDRSILSGIEQLPPATWMTIDHCGRSTIETYWDWNHDPLALCKASLDDAIMQTQTLLDTAVARRLEADVPLGCFLSGGIDSSLIAAIAQKQLAAKGEILRTFSVAMPDSHYDESPYAAAVAQHIGSSHTQLTAQPSIENDLRSLIAVMGEPFGDSSLLPTYWLSCATRDHVKVALSGDGGDELFGGYDRYRAMAMLQRHAWWMRALPRQQRTAKDQKSRWSRLARLLTAARQPAADLRYRSITDIFSPSQLANLGLELPSSVTLPTWNNAFSDALAAREWDLACYLPHDLLRKVDRASMAVALEVRCPFLDREIWEYATHLRQSSLFAARRSKKILRTLAAQYLPHSITHRPKMGFAIPLGQWWRTSLRPLLQGYLLDTHCLADLGMRNAAVENVVNQHLAETHDHTHRLFILLSLAMWQQWFRDTTHS